MNQTILFIVFFKFLEKLFHKTSDTDNAFGLIIKTHETPLYIEKIWILTYSLDFALSNKYFK